MPYLFSMQDDYDWTDGISLSSTSRNTAVASDIMLNETNRLRLRFVPTIVNNPNDANKCVEGKIILERKRPSSSAFALDQPDAFHRITRGSVSNDDWLELSLDTSETFELYSGLSRMYALHSSVGVPVGYGRYVEVDASTLQVIDLLKRDPSAVRMLAQEENFEIIQSLLRVMTQAESLDALRKSIERLEDDSIQRLNDTLTAEQLQRVISEFEGNIDNGQEEYWQSTIFGQYPWILSQLFAAPITYFCEKAYVGGKGLTNSGGNVCDFIYRNHMTKNVCLIEIKTPQTNLLGIRYRQTYAMSNELSGAINQVLNYKDAITKEYNTLAARTDDDFEVLSPHCAVIIGNTAELVDKSKIVAFENFRGNLSGITIITYDEVLRRLKDLMSVITS